MEEEPSASGALSGMRIGLPFAQAEPHKLLNLWSADMGEGKKMIEFNGHVKLT
jgi:hypothetical protein